MKASAVYCSANMVTLFIFIFSFHNTLYSFVIQKNINILFINTENNIKAYYGELYSLIPFSYIYVYTSLDISLDTYM